MASIAHGLWGQAKFSEVEPGPFATLVSSEIVYGISQEYQLMLPSLHVCPMCSDNSSSFTPISIALLPT